MGSKVNTGDLAGGEWRRNWRLRGWGVRLALETWQVGSEDDSGDLGAGEGRRHWRLRGWGVRLALET